MIRNLAGNINYGYGAICQAKEKEQIVDVLICTNQAFAFKIKKLKNNEIVPLNKIAEFTSNYCYGG